MSMRVGSGAYLGELWLSCIACSGKLVAQGRLLEVVALLQAHVLVDLRAAAETF